MCTVSWVHSPQGYVLYFNRDESRTRSPATGPVGGAERGVKFLAPRDGEQGGAWILVNELGLTLGLLNHYPPGFRAGPGSRPSRGRLILECADLADGNGLGHRLAGMDLRPYPPFRLIAVDRGDVRLLTWDGKGLRSGGKRRVKPPVTSSSREPERVDRFRRRLFKRMTGSGRERFEELEAYHHWRDSSRPAESVLMCRSDACTHSVVRVEVEGAMATLLYEPQSWIEQSLTVRQASLALRP